MHRMILNNRIEANNVLVHELRAESLSVYNVHEFLHSVNPYLQAWRKIVLDISGVFFIDTIGVSALFFCRQYLKDRQGFFPLCELSSAVIDIFKLMKMHRDFQTFDTCSDAISDFEVLQC
jgi:anti-sigma B factor antagonist